MKINSKKHLLENLFMVFAVALLTFSCSRATNENLSSWTENAPAKKALVEYVESVTKKGSADFIPLENRIAVFDLDGTLILETDPTYFDWALFEHRVLDDSRYNASEEEREIARNSREKGIMPNLSSKRESMVSKVYTGLSLKEFEEFITDFMEQDQPGFIGMKRGESFYKPMVEVVNYLSENGFTVYICSGTDRLTVRPLVAKNLPVLRPYQVIGSDSTIISSNQGEIDGLSYTFTKGDELILGGKNLVKNLQMNKVAVIAQEVGVQPVLAFGNADNNPYKALGFMLCCDDTEREYGNPKKAAQMKSDCEKFGWIPISMKDDWKTIYGEGVKRR